MKIIVTGAAGLVGRAVVAAFRAQNISVGAFDHAALDISDESAVISTLSSQSPDVVINCAAWTDVDGCEFDKERAHRANARGPEALGYTSGLWTAARVRELIADQCGVRYHEAHVWRILRQLGWSCQRPTGRALERDEEAIRYWKRVRWPRLKKKRSASGAPSSSSTKAG